MEPTDDPQLRKLLREWKVQDAPSSLDQRVLGTRKQWWTLLITGFIRVPVPVGLAIAALLLAMTVALVRERRSPARPADPSTVSLVDFRPVEEPQVRIIARHYEAH
jgi:hypothetical protein